jgi:hypothetical protein
VLWQTEKVTEDLLVVALIAAAILVFILVPIAFLVLQCGNLWSRRKQQGHAEVVDSLPQQQTSASPTTSNGGTPSSAALADRMENLGLWRYLDVAERAAAHSLVAAGEHPWATEMAPSVSFFADGENLAEDGVEEFLTEIAPALETLGVILEVSSETPDQNPTGRYAVTINGHEVEIYNGLDAFNRHDDSFPWFAAQIRPLARINELLSEAGATERFFLLYPGENDSIALLIDPNIVVAIREAGLTEPVETPVLAR